MCMHGDACVMVCTCRNMFSPSTTGDPTQVIAPEFDSRSCQLLSHLTTSVPLLSSELHQILSIGVVLSGKSEQGPCFLPF